MEKKINELIFWMTEVYGMTRKEAQGWAITAMDEFTKPIYKKLPDVLTMISYLRKWYDFPAIAK